MPTAKANDFDKPQPLFRHNWRTYVRLALAPLILIELVLISAYLLTNSLIFDENIRQLRSIASQELARILTQEAELIGHDLQSVEQLTELYRTQTEHAYRTPFDPDTKEKSRYRLSPGGAWYTSSDTGGSAGYYSSLTQIGVAEKRKVWQLSQLDPLMKVIVEANPLVTQIYLNTHDSHNRIYPYFDTLKQYGESLNVPEFNFYYQADADHNPLRKPVWTEVYIDPAGQGWMVSCIAPVYRDGFMEAVVGLDITTKTIIERITTLHIPWGGYGILLDHNGVIMAMPAAAEAELKIRELTDHSYTEVISHDNFKPAEFNIYSHGPLQTLAQRISSTDHGSGSVVLAGNKLVAWTTVAQTGWKLLALIEEQNLYAKADDVGRHFQRLGLLMAGSLVLFYLVFFTYLFLRSRKSSQVVAAQLQAIEQMSEAIGKGDFDHKSPASNILEIKNVAERLVQVGQSLKHSQKVRQEREQELKDILETAQEGFLLIDNNSSTQRVNPAMCEILGRPMDQILGHNFHEFIDADNKHIFEQEIVQRELGLKSRYEISLSRPDGTQVPCLVHASPLFDGDKNKIGSFALVADMTENKIAEERLHAALQSAEAASYAKSEFLSSMSHEIRTPLNGILGMAELLLRTELNDKQTHYLKSVVGSGKHLLVIINDILDFSKIEARRMEIETEPFDPRALVDTVVNLFSEQASSKGISFRIEVDQRLNNSIKGDVHRLRQILFNLIGNAVKFTEIGSVVVRIESLREDPQSALIRFSVADTGMGITPAEQSQIFEAFRQADGSITRRFGGTGLGLPICKRLVELMGGKLELESQPGSGSEFWFSLELERTPPSNENLSTETADSLPRFDADILLAEDNLVNQEVAIAMLEMLGCRVTVVDDGHSALQAYGEQTFDLVLMDLHMPVLGGLETARAIRQQEHNSGTGRVPIFALTADVVQGIQETCRAAGMDGYLAKPFSLPQLLKAISPWLTLPDTLVSSSEKI